MTGREQVRAAFERATLVPARWASERTTRGDFDGRGNTIELFGVPVAEQRLRHRTLAPLRRWAEELLGGHLIIVQHSPAAVEQHYAWIRGVTISGPSGQSVLSTQPSGAVGWAELGRDQAALGAIAPHLARSEVAHPVAAGVGVFTP